MRPNQWLCRKYKVCDTVGVNSKSLWLGQQAIYTTQPEKKENDRTKKRKLITIFVLGLWHMSLRKVAYISLHFQKYKENKAWVIHYMSKAK